MKYQETLPAEPTPDGAIAQFRADARAAGIDRFFFHHEQGGRTKVAAEGPAWRIAKRLMRRRCALRDVLGHSSYTVKIQVGGKMFTVHSKQSTEGDFQDWESAAEHARKIILNKGATDVWIEES